MQTHKTLGVCCCRHNYAHVCQPILSQSLTVTFLSISISASIFLHLTFRLVGFYVDIYA